MSLCMNCMSPVEGKSICPHCGVASSRRNDPTCLQPGAVIGERYIAGTLKDKNGENAVYIGYDTETKRPVRLVEYFPGRLSVRSKNGSVMPLPGYEAQYKALFAECVDICNTVKRLEEKGGVVPIENAITANNTLYAVYSETDAVKLEDYLRRSGGKLPLRRAVKLFEQLCATLGRLHETGELHRGVSPQTIYLGRDGNLYLWGFSLSAARTEGSELDCELYSGFSAPEQYSSVGRQGTWTDVYSTAALFYRAVSGIVPPKPLMAGAYRPVTPLRELDENIPESLSAAVEHAMRLNPSERTQTMGELSSGLALNANLVNTATTAVFEIGRAAQVRPPGNTGSNSKKSQKKGSESGVSVKYVILALFFTVLVLAGFMWFILNEYFSDLIDNGLPGQQSSSISSSQPPSSDDPPSSEVSSEVSQSSEVDDKSVPKFVGLNADSVVEDAKYQERFNFERKYNFNDSYASGVVYDQSPTEGTAMLNRGTVILYVSKGKMSVTMPDLTGSTREEAEEIFRELGDEVEYAITFQVVEKYEAGVEAGKIISTIPAANTDFDPRDKQIYIYVSYELPVSETKEESSKSARRVTSSNDG